MSYRPICDVWILARPKLKDGVKYYGAYPAGFLHRARQMLGVNPTDAVLHVCGGQVKNYLYSGFGPNDQTVDLDPAVKPDHLLDVRSLGAQKKGQIVLTPWIGARTIKEKKEVKIHQQQISQTGFPAILIDRPYTEEDAKHYKPGPEVLPSLNDLLKNCLSLVPLGHRVGVLDYLWPHPGNWGKEVAVIAVGSGRNNRARWFTVFERIKPYDEVK